jgi:predicted transcriptional regulator
VQDDLFGGGLGRSVERVLMSLNPVYYNLIWDGLKRHEFRRRYLTGQPTQWFVYLTAPISRLTAVIDLDEPIVDTPRHIADLAEQARGGNGATVFDYLKDLKQGFAMPITTVREHDGFNVEQLVDRLGSFHPPQGYTLVNRNPALAALCDDLVFGPVMREMTVHHPALIS